MADRKDLGGEDAPLNIMKETIMKAVLKEGPTPKKNLPPEILPFVSKLQPDDILAKGMGVQGDVDSPSTLEELIACVAVLNPHIADPICLRVTYLRESQVGNVRGLQHQPKDMEYAQKIQKFIGNHEFSSDVVLSKEMNRVFLRQLLEDILDYQESSLQGAEKGGIYPDPALVALGAAPSCHRRGNADELFAPILYQW